MAFVVREVSLGMFARTGDSGFVDLGPLFRTRPDARRMTNDTGLDFESDGHVAIEPFSSPVR